MTPNLEEAAKAIESANQTIARAKSPSQARLVEVSEGQYTITCQPRRDQSADESNEPARE